MRSLSDIDLNLLVVLQILLETRSTTRAAQRLGKTQSAISHALRRLREMLQDPLLVRDGVGLVPTDRAVALEGPLNQFLEGARALVFDQPVFEPAQASGVLSLCASEYVLQTFLPALLGRLRREAPRLDLRCKPPRTSEEIAEQLMRGEVDVAFFVGQAPPHLRVRRLFVDRFVSMVCADHPHKGASIGLEGFAAYPHIVTSPVGEGRGAFSVFLASQGCERRVALTVPQFFIGPQLLTGTDYVLTLPARLAAPLAVRGGHRLLELDFSAPSLEVWMGWHDKRHRSLAHRWFRQAIAASLQDHQGQSGP